MDGSGRAHVAQSVEHLHGKEKVIGSIPIVGSTLRPCALRAAQCGLRALDIERVTPVVALARPTFISTQTIH